MSRTTIALIIAGVLIFGVYGWLFSLSTRGFGYIGYRPYSMGPSPLYWGHGTTYYHRDYGGGARGVDVRGGGPRTGK